MPILNIELEKFPAATEIVEALGFSQNRNEYTDLTRQTLLANNGGALSADLQGVDYATLPLVIDGKVSNEIAHLVSAEGVKFVEDFLLDAKLFHYTARYFVPCIHQSYISTWLVPTFVLGVLGG